MPDPIAVRRPDAPIRSAVTLARSLFTPLPLLLASTLPLLGCASKPSQSVGRTVVEHLIEQKSNGAIRLLSFKKTNAQQLSLLGVKIYVMYYQAEIEFVEDAWCGGLLDPFACVRYRQPRRGAFLDTELMLDTLMKERVRSGLRKTISGSLRFESSERGWAGEDGHVY